QLEDARANPPPWLHSDLREDVDRFLGPRELEEQRLQENNGDDHLQGPTNHRDRSGRHNTSVSQPLDVLVRKGFLETGTRVWHQPGVLAMTCRELADFLMDYLDGGLSPDVRAAFEQHLAVCPNCVAYMKTYRTTIELGRRAFDDDQPNAALTEMPA